MLWYCRFTWDPGTTQKAVRERVLRQHAAGTNHPEKIRGWYNLAGGGAGFMIIEADDPRDLNAILEPYMDLVRWDVHAIYELQYQDAVEHFNRMFEAIGMQAGFAAVPAAERQQRGKLADDEASVNEPLA